MFDIGFSEILVIFILALIVLGPERLPRVVREVGRWVGRARAMARQFQEQLEDEVDFERDPPSWRGAAPAPEPTEPPEEKPQAALTQGLSGGEEPHAPEPSTAAAAHPSPSTNEQPGT